MLKQDEHAGETLMLTLCFESLYVPSYLESIKLYSVHMFIWKMK